MKRAVVTGLLIFLLGLFCARLQAAEFRVIRPILTPGALPEGARPVKEIRPVDTRVVEYAVKKIIQAWNKNSLEGVLGKQFYDKSRLSDAMSDKVPRDARLKVLSIQGVQTLSQRVRETERGKFLESLVSTTVRTQIEFNDPVNGFQRREGTNEYIFIIRQRIKEQGSAETRGGG